MVKCNYVQAMMQPPFWAVFNTWSFEKQENSFMFMFYNYFLKRKVLATNHTFCSAVLKLQLRDWRRLQAGILWVNTQAQYYPVSSDGLCQPHILEPLKLATLLSFPLSLEGHQLNWTFLFFILCLCFYVLLHILKTEILIQTIMNKKMFFFSS